MNCYESKRLTPGYAGVIFYIQALHSETFADKRRLRNSTFCPISASGSNFNPRNIQYIPVVEIFVFLKLEQKLPFFRGFTQSGVLVDVGVKKEITAQENTHYPETGAKIKWLMLYHLMTS